MSYLFEGLQQQVECLKALRDETPADELDTLRVCPACYEVSNECVCDPKPASWPFDQVMAALNLRLEMASSGS